MMISSRTSSIRFFSFGSPAVLNDPGRRAVPVSKGTPGIEWPGRGHGRHVVAGTVRWEQLRGLAGFRAAEGCAVSLYLNLDPSQVLTTPDLEARVNSLIRRAERLLE